MPGQRRYSNEDHARRGQEVYEQKVRALIDSQDHGKIVAIDIDSGSFEVADGSLVAAERLIARCPEAQIWFVRVGHRGVHRFGPRTLSRPA
jgi:hypothetical protein